MKTVLNTLDRLSNLLSRIGIALAGAAIALVAVMIFANVILRSIFDINMPFVEEYAMMAMVPMSYLGLGYTLRQNKHLAADILISRMSARNRHLMLLFAAAFGLFVLCFLMERAWDLFSHNWTFNITSNGPMRTPMWIPSLIVLIGLGTFAIDVLFWITHLCLNLFRKKGLLFE